MAALDLLGYAPQLAVVRVVREAAAGEAGGVQRRGGRVPVRQLRAAGDVPVPLAAIKVLRLMAAGDLETYRRLKLDDALMDCDRGVLTTQLEHHLDRRLKSLQFLHIMITPRSGEGRAEG